MKNEKICVYRLEDESPTALTDIEGASLEECEAEFNKTFGIHADVYAWTIEKLAFNDDLVIVEGDNGAAGTCPECGNFEASCPVIEDLVDRVTEILLERRILYPQCGVCGYDFTPEPEAKFQGKQL